MNTEGKGSAGVSPAVFGVPPDTSSPVRTVKLGQRDCNGLISLRSVQPNRTASQPVAAIWRKVRAKLMRLLLFRGYSVNVNPSRFACQAGLPRRSPESFRDEGGSRSVKVNQTDMKSC